MDDKKTNTFSSNPKNGFNIEPSSTVYTNESISLKQATFMMVSLSFGTAILTLPYTVDQLGPVSWNLFLFIIIITFLYCSHLLQKCCVKFLEDKKDPKYYPALYINIAEEYVSPLFSRILAFTLQLTYGCLGLSMYPLSATVVSALFPIPDWSVANQIRLWCFILLLIASPLMYFGFYKDLKTTAYFSCISSSIAAVIVIVLSLVLKFQHSIEKHKFFHDKRPSHENFFVTFGTLCYSVVGPALIISNISTFAKRREKLHYSLIWAYIILFSIYVITAMVPYSVFGAYVHPSLVNTFGLYANELSPASRACIVICKITLLIHMLLASVMILNPLFTNFESYLNIPFKFSWRRFLLRTSGILIILAISCLIPNFQPIVSIVGAVPAVMVSVVFPITIYGHAFETSLIEKSVLFALCTFSIIFMVGNFAFSIMNAVHVIMTP